MTSNFFPKDQKTRIEEARAAQEKFLEGVRQEQQAKRDEAERQAEKAERRPFSHLSWH